MIFEVRIKKYNNDTAKSNTLPSQFSIIRVNNKTALLKYHEFESGSLKTSNATEYSGDFFKEQLIRTIIHDQTT